MRNVLCHHAHLLVDVVVVPVECFDKIKCCVVRVCLSWEGSQGVGKGVGLKGGNRIVMVLFLILQNNLVDP